MSCDHCYQGYILEGEPQGEFFDGAYLSPALKRKSSEESDSSDEDAGGGPSCAIVLLTDIFGLALKNPKIIADELAARVGCDVWVPDLFDGAYAPPPLSRP